jgi:hypothetical protein
MHPRRTRGRKRASESRSEEIRAKLTEWKQTPEHLRPSLRALARELRTSHQLLSHYLEHSNKWRAKEYRQRANEIRARVQDETRPWAKCEMLRQADRYDRAGLRCTLVSVMEDALRKWEQEIIRDVRAGKRPHSGYRRLLRKSASAGFKKAQALLERYFPKGPENNLPVLAGRAAKSFGYVEGAGGNSPKTPSGAG